MVKVSAMTYGAFRPAENKALPTGSRVDPRHEIRAGDLLVSRANTTAYVGAAVIVPAGVRARLLLSDKSLRLRVPGDVDRSWLRWLLASPQVRKTIEAMASGTKDSMRNISQSKLEALLLPVPPAAEQRRIADQLRLSLSEIQRLSEAVTSIARRLDQFREHVIAAAVLGRLGTQLSSDEPAIRHLAERLPDMPSRPVEEATDLPGLPDGWTWAVLGDLAVVVGGVTKDSKKQDDPAHVEVPFLRVANVQRGFLRLDHIARIKVPAAKVNALRLLPGDVLMNEGGDRDKLGRGWVWSGQIKDCIHQNHVFRARVRERVLRPELMSHYGNTHGQAWFELAGKQTTNLASISLTSLKRLPVPVPPLKEQDRILALLETELVQLNALRNLVSRVSGMVDQLQRAVLRQAFAGRLVAQDPTDEPAELLLKRIEVDRAAQPKATGRRRRTVTTTRDTEAPADEETA